MAHGNDRVAQVPPDRFLRGPAKDHFGIPVPAGDVAVGVGRDDRVQRRLDDAAQPCLGRRELPRRLPLLIADECGAIAAGQRTRLSARRFLRGQMESSATR